MNGCIPSDNETDIVNKVNNDYFNTMIPYLIYIVIILVFGITGNITVFLVYLHKKRKTTQHIFILTLAGYDLITCAICLPFSVVRTTMAFVFPSDFFCRIGFANLVLTVSASNLIIIFIAVDRYFKVCRPFRKGIERKTAKILAFSTFPSGIVVCVPVLVLFGIATRSDPVTGVCGRECFIRDSMVGTPLLTAYLGICCLMYLSTVVIISTLYVLVGKKSYMRRLRSLEKKRRSSTLQSNLNLSIMEDDDNSNRPSAKMLSVTETNGPPGTPISIRSIGNSIGTSKQNGDGTLEKVGVQKNKQNAIKTEKMLLAVTIFFIFSWLPYWIMIFGTSAYRSFLQPRTQLEHVLRRIFFESFYLNNMVNPIIYAFMNNVFRDDLRAILRKKCGS